MQTTKTVQTGLGKQEQTGNSSIPNLIPSGLNSKEWVSEWMNDWILNFWEEWKWSCEG